MLKVLTEEIFHEPMSEHLRTGGPRQRPIVAGPSWEAAAGRKGRQSQGKRSKIRGNVELLSQSFSGSLKFAVFQLFPLGGAVFGPQSTASLRGLYSTCGDAPRCKPDAAESQHWPSTQTHG
jgi:hypothetical protein